MTMKLFGLGKRVVRVKLSYHENIDGETSKDIFSKESFT